MKNQIIRYIKIFFILIIIFSFGLLLVYQIPNNALEPQYSKSVAQIEQEDTYANILFASDASIMDNFMDNIMVRTCRVPETYENSVQAAFDNNGYPRYWNGYLLTLRPMLSQFTWQQIRYINGFLLLTVFCFCFSEIHRQYSAVAAMGFAISIIACFLVLIGESLQYFSVFMILFCTILVILYIPYFRKKENSLLLLFATGMITNYFDMLTAPLLTLGIPLILIISRPSQSNDALITNIKNIFRYSLSWGMGYGLTWAAKWAIGTMILGKNVFKDAMNTARFRVEGSESYPLDRKLMFKLNFETYFFAKGHKPLIFLAAIIIVLMILLIRFHRKNWLDQFISVLLIASFPWLWYSIFANHSQLHYFYTYRIQAIALFSVFAAFSCSIDFSEVKRSLKITR